MVDHTTLIAKIYSLMDKGDFDKAISNVADGAKWHVLGLGIEVAGRDKVAEFIKGLYGQGFKQHILHSAEHGDVVVCWIEGTLPGGSTYKSCVVHRFEGDEIAEYTSVRV